MEPCVARASHHIELKIPHKPHPSIYQQNTHRFPNLKRKKLKKINKKIWQIQKKAVILYSL